MGPERVKVRPDGKIAYPTDQVGQGIETGKDFQERGEGIDWIESIAHEEKRHGEEGDHTLESLRGFHTDGDC